MNAKLIILILITAVLSAAGGFWISGLRTSEMGVSGSETTERKPLFYRSPMNPSVTSPTPAKDSMGMDYVPVFADKKGAGPSGTVKIDPVTTQDIGVKTAKVVKMSFSSNVQAVGRVTYNEENMTRLHPKVAGWIEQLIVNKTGALVKEGDVLLKIYSPQLVTGQQEYILAMKNLKNVKALKGTQFNELYQNAQEMASTSRQRLTLLDVPEHQIKELEKKLALKKSLHIHSISTGAAIKINAREGQYVTPKDELFMIADLSNVWVIAEVYENDLPWIKKGNEVHLRLSGLPGKVFKGKLVYIYPYAQEKTRTIQVRMVFDNPGLDLKPDMFANVTINSGKTIDALMVPTEAIVRTGSREQVYVVRAPGKFEPRPVTLGLNSDTMTQVLSGVSLGEEVVTSAMFMIDSESKLREATEKMQGQDTSAPKETQPIQKMDMDMKMEPAPKASEMNMNSNSHESSMKGMKDHQKMNPSMKGREMQMEMPATEGGKP